ncbi:hypothetical protein F183_A08050 [Bryobacterales bacterium F-183]|nr:hypothetical protein F183_A08050 [Bryobacterales bacterium F-183]
MLLGSAGLRADVVLLSENFDDISTLTGNGWTLSNQSTPAVGVNPGWFQGEPNTFAARSGAANSYISANYLNASVGGNVRNWLILPQLTVGPNTVLTFYTSTDTSLFPGDVLTVQVAAAGSGTYNTLLTIGDPNSAAYPTGWTKYSVNVGGAVPANVDIALVYSVQDTSINGNVIGIDDLSVVNVTSAVPEPGAWLTLSVMLTGVALRKRRQQKEGV